MSCGHTGARRGRAARVARAAVWAGHDGAIPTCAGRAKRRCRAAERRRRRARGRVEVACGDNELQWLIALAASQQLRAERCSTGNTLSGSAACDTYVTTAKNVSP
jgi:hypothetical protein